MGVLLKTFLVSTTLFIALVAVGVYHVVKPLEVPVYEEPYWGPGDPPQKQRTDITRMNITFSDEMIEDLKHRLANTRYTPPLEGAAQEYGFNANLLMEIVDFWRSKYAFKEREAFLNKYPHFRTNIQGLDIHYIHVKPKHTYGLTVLPLLLLHGWPGTIREFYDVIPLLTTEHPSHDFVFEVIAPSLPGFGYSQAAAKPGCGAVNMAIIMKNLMLRLGHDKFYVQGGDWGSMIASHMATLYREHVIGLHCNMCLVNTPRATMKRLFGALYPKAIIKNIYYDRFYPLGAWFKNMVSESGYFHIQATKPDTVGVGLNDSPAGLVAYILEKFITLTDPAYKKRVDGGLKDVFKYEDLLDNIMIYWVTGTMTTAMRIYAESTKTNLQRVPIVVPSACANFKHEIFYAPESILKDRYVKLVQNTHFGYGGHFIAMEIPQELAGDIFSAVDTMRNPKPAKILTYHDLEYWLRLLGLRDLFY